MKIKVEVEMYGAFGRKTVEVDVTEDDLRVIAEKKVMADYSCESCTGKTIDIAIQA